MSNQQTNINSSFFLLFRKFSFVKQSTMPTGLTNPGYQGSDRYTPSAQFTKLQGQVDEVTDVMRENIRLELERGGKLDDLEGKTDALNENSRQFAVRSRTLKKKYWWKNVKMCICLIIVILVILTIIIVASVLGTKKKS